MATQNNLNTDIRGLGTRFFSINPVEAKTRLFCEEISDELDNIIKNILKKNNLWDFTDKKPTANTVDNPSYLSSLFSSAQQPLPKESIPEMVNTLLQGVCDIAMVDSKQRMDSVGEVEGDAAGEATQGAGTGNEGNEENQGAASDSSNNTSSLSNVVESIF